MRMEKIIRDGDLVPPRNQSISGVCPDCRKAGIPPRQTRLCYVCLKCGKHCKCEI